MSNSMHGRQRPRLNIYMPDTVIRRQVKATAAEQGVSVSEYCVRAIARQLERDHGALESPEIGPQSISPVEHARAFQKEAFQGRRFSVSSADLIRESREADAPR